MSPRRFRREWVLFCRRRAISGWADRGVFFFFLERTGRLFCFNQSCAINVFTHYETPRFNHPRRSFRNSSPAHASRYIIKRFFFLRFRRQNGHFARNVQWAFTHAINACSNTVLENEIRPVSYDVTASIARWTSCRRFSQRSAPRRRLCRPYTHYNNNNNLFPFFFSIVTSAMTENNGYA